MYTFERYAEAFQLYSLGDLEYEDLTTLSSHLIYEINHGPHSDNQIDRHGHALVAVQNEIHRRLLAEQAKDSGRHQIWALIALVAVGGLQAFATLKEKRTPVFQTACPAWPDTLEDR